MLSIDFTAAKTRLRTAIFASLGLTSALAVPAHAAGTTAGTTISNIATATYTGPNGPVSVPSNRVDLRVDEVLNVTVTSGEAGDIVAQAGSTNQVARFKVTNTGNGGEAFRLSPITAIAGDNFDPTSTSVVIDTNGNGVYDAGVDTVYNGGSNDPVLAPDASVVIFVLSTIPGSAADTQRGEVDLAATAVKGSGPAGTVFAGQGVGGGDAVVGTTTAAGRDKDFYIVSAATVALVKSATVLDPFGGTKSVPGSIISYSLVATTTGSGTLANLAVGDAVPASTTYVPGSITAQGSALTDATDGDAGEIANGTVAVRFGAVPSGQTRTVTFKVKIN